MTAKLTSMQQVIGTSAVTVSAGCGQAEPDTEARHTSLLLHACALA